MREYKYRIDIILAQEVIKESDWFHVSCIISLVKAE